MSQFERVVWLLLEIIHNRREINFLPFEPVADATFLKSDLILWEILINQFIKSLLQNLISILQKAIKAVRIHKIGPWSMAKFLKQV